MCGMVQLSHFASSPAGQVMPDEGSIVVVPAGPGLCRSLAWSLACCHEVSCMQSTQAVLGCMPGQPGRDWVRVQGMF